MSAADNYIVTSSSQRLWECVRHLHFKVAQNSFQHLDLDGLL